MQIYPWQMDSPVNQAFKLWIVLHQTWQIYIYIYIEQCTDTHARFTPLPIEHRYLEYRYTKLGTCNGRLYVIWKDLIFRWSIQIQIYPPFQMNWTTLSTFQMKCTLRPKPRMSWYFQMKYSDSDIPPISDELNNSVNFSDEVHTERKTCNELIFSDEVFRFRYETLCYSIMLLVFWIFQQLHHL